VLVTEYVDAEAAEGRPPAIMATPTRSTDRTALMLTVSPLAQLAARKPSV